MAGIDEKLVSEEDNTTQAKCCNDCQATLASLEAQVTEKDELIEKLQKEVSQKEKVQKKLIEDNLCKYFNSKTKLPLKELEDMMKSLQDKESQLTADVVTLHMDAKKCMKVMEEYEKTIATQVTELQRLNEDNETAKQHLANLELAFSDVHQKYERSKAIIAGYRCNEDALRSSLVNLEESVVKSEEKYESLKAHAKAQIDKSNQEIEVVRGRFENELHKMNTIVKRLEIKNASLMDSLEQKTKECTALAALCDEVTGKKM